MTIALSDLPAAAAAYIDTKVTVTVTDVTTNLNPGEEGTYTVTVRNADQQNGGVRLQDLRLHVEVSNPAVALLMPHNSALTVTRERNDRDLPELASSARVPSMVIFFDVIDTVEQLNDTLGIDEEMVIELGYEAVAAGNATIRAHVHASVDVDDLFPSSSGTNGSRALTVRP